MFSISKFNGLALVCTLMVGTIQIATAQTKTRKPGVDFVIANPNSDNFIVEEKTPNEWTVFFVSNNYDTSRKVYTFTGHAPHEKPAELTSYIQKAKSVFEQAKTHQVWVEFTPNTQSINVSNVPLK